MTLLLVRSMKTAIPSLLPTIAPTSVSCGVDGSLGAGGGGGGAAATGPATAGAGARRDGLNSGRSRVALNADSGIAHKGFPLGSAGRGGCAAGAAGAISTGAGNTALGA